MYLIHCTCRLSRVGASLSLSLLSTGHLSCLIAHPLHRCCPSPTLLLSVPCVVVVRPPCCCCPSPTLLLSIPRIIIVRWTLLSVTHIVIVVRRPFVLQGPCRPSPTSLLLSMGQLSCGGLVPVVIWWASSSVPHIIIIVIHVPCCHRCPVGATSSVPHHYRCRRCLMGLRRPFPTSSSPAVPHIVVVVVIHRPFDLQRPRRCRCLVGALSSVPHVIVTSRPPQHRHHHCPQAI